MTPPAKITMSESKQSERTYQASWKDECGDECRMRVTRMETCFEEPEPPQFHVNSGQNAGSLLLDIAHAEALWHLLGCALDHVHAQVVEDRK